MGETVSSLTGIFRSGRQFLLSECLFCITCFQTPRSGGDDEDNLSVDPDSDGQAFEALRSVRKLAEVKRVFDRFAVDGMLTANEALQALTEAGCTAPRTHAGRYLRSRRFFGLRREVMCQYAVMPSNYQDPNIT